MNPFALNVGLGGIIGGGVGGVVNAAFGYFSNDNAAEYQRRILIGVIAGIAIAAVGTAIALSNSTGAVMGALVGFVFVIGTFHSVDNNPNERIFTIIQNSLPIISITSLIGYVFDATAR